MSAIKYQRYFEHIYRKAIIVSDLLLTFKLILDQYRFPRQLQRTFRDI